MKSFFARVNLILTRCDLVYFYLDSCNLVAIINILFFYRKIMCQNKPFKTANYLSSLVDFSTVVWRDRSISDYRVWRNYLCRCLFGPGLIGLDSHARQLLRILINLCILLKNQNGFQIQVIYEVVLRHLKQVEIIKFTDL